MQALKQRGDQLARRLGDLLFPPICTGCGIGVGQPSALCPACWAKLRFIERPYCDILCLPFSYDPGEGIVSAEAIADPPPFEKLRAVVLYDDMARRLVSSLKYRDRLDLVPLMAAWMMRAGGELVAASDVVIPVPLHRRRLWQRQFNQSAEIGRSIAKTTGLQFAPAALDRIKPTRKQVGLGRNQRRDNVRGAFKVRAERRDEVLGKSVLLIDDVFTTGSTASSATKALKRAGAHSVNVLTFARVAAFDM
ncbi:ComF family protein [Fulvimarina sp. MAC8]|uniref:ComF family protein n=1 Tax=Fulvimarina sp. MAC8 TaxID=3162874 RepID=UPI0032EF5D00